MPFQTSFICHARGIQQVLPRFNATANISALSFQLRVRGRNRYYDLLPQFVHRVEGRMRYSPNMPEGDEGLGFIGWLPYFNKRWPEATDKLAFKEYCAKNALRTPRHSTQAADGLESYLVKRRRSSFGYHLRGPFRNERPGPATPLGEDEFYEEFIQGTIAKAIYWDDKLTCLELEPMPAVVGDGVQTLPGLIAGAVIPPQRPPERTELEALARYQDLSLDAPVPAGRSVLADFRYGSPLFPLTMKNRNQLSKHASSAVGRQFAEAAPVLWRAVPENARASTLYSVDAIVDREERVWFLEMNCNPAVHPDAYVAMFESLFGPAQAPAQQPVVPEPPAWPEFAQPRRAAALGEVTSMALPFGAPPPPPPARFS